MTDETLEAFRELWTSDDPWYHGEFVRFENIIFEPKPVQKPGRPIWIGGAWSSRAMAGIRSAPIHVIRWTPRHDFVTESHS